MATGGRFVIAGRLRQVNGDHILVGVGGPIYLPPHISVTLAPDTSVTVVARSVNGKMFAESVTASRRLGPLPAGPLPG